MWMMEAEEAGEGEEEGDEKEEEKEEERGWCSGSRRGGQIFWLHEKVIGIAVKAQTTRGGKEVEEN